MENTMIRTTISKLGLRLCAALIASLGGVALAETQTFDVTVPSVLTITPPSAASRNHDTNDADQVFSAQEWTIASNAAAGASATFTSGVFQHTVAAAYKADCRLQLAVESSEAAASWAITTASDVSDYANGTPVLDATVVAASTAAGNASLNLTVTFVQDDYSILASGTYRATVTGTLLAN